MSKIKIIDIPIYNTSVCFFIVGTKEELDILKEDNPHKIDQEIYTQILTDIEQPDKCDGFTIPLLDMSYLIYIRDGLEYNPRICIHEIFHVVNYTLTDRGVKHEETAEALAYLIGWLTEEYYKFLNQEEENEKDI